MDKISLIINTEKGRLEGESKLLIDSIRTFGGRFKNVPIYSYQPRKAFPISKSTIRFFEQYEVNYIDVPINQKFPDYPLANKIYACAHAEQHLNSELLVFMDSDSVVWQEPTVFYNLGDTDVAMTPVFRKIGLAVKENDRQYQYWQRLSAILNFPLDHHVHTVVDYQKVLAYYNSGLIVAKRNVELFQQAQANFERLVKTDKAFFLQRFLEQSNLTATILSMDLNLLQLGEAYNYPLRHHNNIQNPIYQLDSLDDVITGHYTVLFKKARWRNPLTNELTKGAKGEWFKQKVQEYSLLPPRYKRVLQMTKNYFNIKKNAL